MLRDALDLPNLVTEGLRIRQMRARQRVLYAITLLLIMGSVLLPDLLPGIPPLTGLVGIFLAILLVAYVVYPPMARLNARRIAAVRAFLTEQGLTPPATTQQQQAVQPRRSFLIVAVFTAIFVLEAFLLFVIAAPLELVLAIALGAWLLYWLRGTITRALNLGNVDAEARFRARRTLFFIAVFLLLLVGFALLVSALLRPLNLSFLTGGVVSGVLSGVGAWLAFRLLIALPLYRLYYGPLARGDYDGALRQVIAMQQRIPYLVNGPGLRLIVLGLAGRFREMEAGYRAMLADGNSISLHEAAYSVLNLAYSLIGQERFAEALPLLEVLLPLFPEDYRMYSALQDFYLNQDNAPEDERVFALDDALKPFYRRGWNIFNPLRRYDEVNAEATAALVLALRGRSAEAEAAAARAIIHAGRRFQPIMAVAHFYAGQVKRQSGDMTAARAAWEQAAALDPAGQVGQQARDLLALS